MFAVTRLIGAAAVASGLLAAPIAASAEDIVIGHSQPNLGWPYIAAVTNALEAAAADMDGVEVVTLSADGDIAKQSSDINSLVNRGVEVWGHERNYIDVDVPIDNIEPGAILYATLVGAALALLTVRARSILPAAVAHAAHNAVPLLVPERVLRVEGLNTLAEAGYHLHPLIVLTAILSALLAARALLHSLETPPDA